MDTEQRDLYFRIGGTAFLVLAFGISVGYSIAHSVIVHEMTETGQADPADLAKAMRLPMEGALTAIPIGFLGIAMIVYSYVHHRFNRS